MKNIFKEIPADMNEEFFDILVQSGNVKVERIISKGHASPDSGWYDQEHNEWVIVLKGEAVLAFEPDREVNLKPGNHVNIPAHTRHKVKWTVPNTETIWIAVHYQ